jgi:hypothetical protein
MDSKRTITTHRHQYRDQMLWADRYDFDFGHVDLIDNDGIGPSVEVWDVFRPGYRRAHCLAELGDQTLSGLSDKERELIEAHIPADLP